jgi:L-alanine-DL-glutamate epimerase-like enolase superfamily enzyme
MPLHCQTIELHPRREFRISRARKSTLHNVFLRFEKDGVTGVGEASPNAFYAETWEGVTAKLEGAAAFIESLVIRSVADIERAWADAWPLLAPSRAAQCALDLALWDWLAQREGIAVTELAWDRKPRAVATFCTIGLSSADELPAKMEELHDFPHIKIKSDRTAGLDTVRYVRERTAALIAVDANCAWNAADLAPHSRELATLNTAFIEQPLPPAEDHHVGTAGSCLPLFADESCVTEEDVPRIAAHFDGFNIKLVKCGGLTPALRMVRRGRELGRKLMVGCMLESSVGIAAGAVIAQETDFADLDGAWLLADDPFEGWKFDTGTLTPPDRAGLGVRDSEIGQRPHVR